MPTLERPTLERNAHAFTKSAYPGATLERDARVSVYACASRLPWSYPGARRPCIRVRVCESPTLELPWSDVPVCMKRLPWSYPGATLELPCTCLPCTRLPCTYPGARTPALPRLPGRLPPPDLAVFPSPSLPSPRAPQGPRVSQNPPAPRLPWSSPWTLAGPLEGAADGRATWAAGLGLAVQFAFSAKVICMGNRPNRLTAERARRAYPGATLEPAGEDERTHTVPGESAQGRRGERRLPWSRSPAYPTPPRRGKVERSQPTKPNAPENPYAPPPREDVLGKSRRSTAYPQQIVTTRLLYCLQDRFAQLSRLQRI